MSIFSTPRQLDEMRRMLANFVRLPFSRDNIPGALMESVFSHVHGGIVLNTYDFVDVILPGSRCGWQVKSAKAGTPLTWKRAKIPNSAELIGASEGSEEGLQALGTAIIEFCNEHARASMERYHLDEIGYARLIVHKNGRVTYFEKLLCSTDSPHVFDPAEFSWKWSIPKTTITKEQLSALHGTHLPTGKKWWAWHGRGENQLHFSGESVWWPAKDNPHSFSFELPSPTDRLSFDQFMSLLQTLDT